MTTPLPPSTDYTAAANQLAKKTFMTAVRTYLNDFLGPLGHGFDAALVSAPRRITVAGTADAMTATLVPAITAYTTGMRVTALLPGANTVTGPTLNLNSLGNKTVKKKSGTGAKVALVAGDYNATLPFELEYDGTDFVLLNPLVAARADIASAGTLDLSATSGALRITGTTTVTAVTLASGQMRFATADAALPLTHGANLILPGSANYTCAAGDALLFTGEPSSVVRVRIWKADGTAVVAGTSAPAVRQSVLSGPVDSSGFSAFGGSTGSTTVTATGTLKATAAAGGDANYTGSTVNPSWTGLSTNGTMYLYLDITAGGVVTTGSTTLAPIYNWGGNTGGAPYTTSGQNVFNIQEMKMYVGPTPTQVYRVFVGEVTVAGGVVTAITWYQLMGRYESGWTATLPVGVGTVSFNHNLGLQPDAADVFIECTTNDGPFVVGDKIRNPNQGSSTPYFTPTFGMSKTTMKWYSGANSFNVPTSGSFTVLTAASWKYKATARRGW